MTHEEICSELEYGVAVESFSLIEEIFVVIEAFWDVVSGVLLASVWDSYFAIDDEAQTQLVDLLETESVEQEVVVEIVTSLVVVVGFSDVYTSCVGG